MLCDIPVGTELKAVGPSGHFVLSENNNNKLFIGTGTGLVPLYNQILGAAKAGQTGNLHLLFGVRTKSDVFYIEELNAIKNNNPQFNYSVYLSQEKTNNYKYGYTTDYLTPESVENYQEFYICGAPGMIDSATKKLTDL